MFVYPGIEREKLYQPEYVMLLEAAVNMMKRACKNFIFTTLYEPYMPNRDINIARHEKYKKTIIAFGCTYIEFHVRWRMPNSNKWYKEQAILLGTPRADCLTEYLGKKDSLPNDGIVLVGQKLTNRGTFLLKTEDCENAVTYFDGNIKRTELFTPDSILNFYNELRGRQVQFLNLDEDNCGKETRPAGWISAMGLEKSRMKLMTQLAAGKTLEELEE